MTIQEMIDWFKIVQDMYGSPYFSDSEYVSFLNRAQDEYVSRTIPDNEGDETIGKRNLESDQNIYQNIAPLVWELPATTMDTTGKIVRSTLEANLQSTTGDSTTQIHKILSIEYKKGVKRFPCKVLRHNSKAAFEENYFKKPAQFSPRFLLQNGNIQFRPTDINTQIYVTVLKTPRPMSLVPAIDCELPKSTHNEIVAYGLQFAGVASRDEVLISMNKVQLPQ
jgi:hypothetical protein